MADDSIRIGAPDGSVVEFPAGTPDSTIKVVMAKNYPAQGGGGNPELAAAAGADMHPDDAGMMHTIRNALLAADPYVRAAANGMTLGLADRFAAGAGALTGVGGTSGDYAGNLTAEQNKTDQFAAQHPLGNAAAQTAGAIATLPFAPAARALEGATLGAKTLAGMGAGAMIGGAQGAFSSRDLTDLPQTIRDAAFGAGVGALVGGTVPIVGRGIGAGVNWLADAVRSTPGMSRAAAKQLLPAVAADGPDAVQAALDRLGPDATLSDAGPALLGKAQGAALNSDEGRSTLTTELTRRNEGTNARIQAGVDSALGPMPRGPDGQLLPADPQSVTDDILAHRTAVDNVNYPAALDNAAPVDVQSILTQLNNHIPRTVGMERKALENLRNEISMPGEEPASPASPAAAPIAPAPASPADGLAADVAAIRAKYGDAAADAYQRQQQPAAQSVPSLLQFLASKGGLGPDSELDAIGAQGHVVNVDGVGRRRLVKQGGLPLDYAREAAEEAGYLQGENGATSTPRDLLDAIDAEMRGQKRYPAGLEGAESKGQGAARSEREQAELDRHMQGFHDDLEAAGHGDIGADVKQRAVHLMANEGMDADAAVDHAIGQLEQEDAAGGGFPGDRKPAAATAPAKKAGPPPRVAKDDATVLHKIKEELDNVIQYDAPGLGVPAGAVKNQQGSLKWFRFHINKALENQVPGYREANDASEALAKRAEAVKNGAQLLGAGKTSPPPARFAADFGPLQPGEKIAFAKGNRGDIDRILGQNANDLAALKRNLQGEGGWNTANIATVHGQPAADELAATVDRNIKFRDTYNKVVENSQTAQRQAAAKAMKPEPSSETPIVNPNMTVTGLAGTAAKRTAVALANALLRTDPTKSFGEVAKILSANGPEARAYLNALAGTLNRRAAIAPTVNRAADQAALVAALGGSKYARDRLYVSPGRQSNGQ